MSWSERCCPVKSEDYVQVGGPGWLVLLEFAAVAERDAEDLNPLYPSATATTKVDAASAATVSY